MQGHYGVGISLYFKFLKWLGWTSLMMFVIVLPEVIINTWGSNKGALLDSSVYVLSLGNLGEVNGTINVPCWGQYIQNGVEFCPMERSDIAWLYSILGEFFCDGGGVLYHLPHRPHRRWTVTSVVFSNVFLSSLTRLYRNVGVLFVVFMVAFQ